VLLNPKSRSKELRKYREINKSFIYINLYIDKYTY